MAQTIALAAKVVRDQTVRRGVVLVDAPAVAVSTKYDVALARRQTPEVRNANLDNETAAWLEVDCRIREASDLLLLRDEVSDGVENEVDKPERAVDARAGHVADRHLEVATPRLLTQLLDHGLRQLDSTNLDAAGRQRERNSSGAYCKLESPALACELSEHLDRRLNCGQIEHLRYGFVVDPSDVGPEMILKHKAIVALTPVCCVAADRSARTNHP